MPDESCHAVGHDDVINGGADRRGGLWPESHPKWYVIRYHSGKGSGVSITASEARKDLFPLIRRVNEDHDTVEIVSRHGNAVLMSADDYAALREGAYLLRSPANARRLLTAYENALSRRNLTERELIDPDSVSDAT